MHQDDNQAQRTGAGVPVTCRLQGEASVYKARRLSHPLYHSPFSLRCSRFAPSAPFLPWLEHQCCLQGPTLAHNLPGLAAGTGSLSGRPPGGRR